MRLELDMAQLYQTGLAGSGQVEGPLCGPRDKAQFSLRATCTDGETLTDAGAPVEVTSTWTSDGDEIDDPTRDAVDDDGGAPLPPPPFFDELSSFLLLSAIPSASLAEHLLLFSSRLSVSLPSPCSTWRRVHPPPEEEDREERFEVCETDLLGRWRPRCGSDSDRIRMSGVDRSESKKTDSSSSS